MLIQVGVTGAVPPCNTGLACLPLQAGGDAGSGYGYCTVLGRPDGNLVGAAAVHVSVRQADSGQSCRLPVVYKCAPAAPAAAAPLPNPVHDMSLLLDHLKVILPMTASSASSVP